jgi:hypothetical protein
MSKKQEFKYEWRKTVNEAWAASAYFISDEHNKRYTITSAASPYESAKTAKPYVKEHLDQLAKEYLLLNPSFRRVNHDE